MEQEYASFPDVAKQVTVPQYMKEVIAEITSLARHSPEINQCSVVSLRGHRQLRNPPEFSLQAQPAPGGAHLPESERPAPTNRSHYGEDRAGERGGGPSSTSSHGIPIWPSSKTSYSRSTAAL